MRIRRLVDTPTAALAAAMMGVYLLVVVGATASLTEASQACSSWLFCADAFSDPAAAVGLGHRVVAAAVAGLVVTAAVAAFRGDTTRRVRASAAAALALYPVQVAFGAVIATTSTGLPLPGLHLGVGLLIFGTLVLALAWQLEYETGANEEQPVEDVDPIDAEEPDAAEGPAPTPLAERPLHVQLRARVLAYARLTKPRLMWLLCLVAAAAMALAAGPALTVTEVLLTLGGGVLAIGASGTFNHVLEREKDRKMSRTNDRPLVTHEVPERNAIVFGLVLSVLSVAVFLQLNPLAAALGLTAIVFYSVVYTLILKPNTAQPINAGSEPAAPPMTVFWTVFGFRISV